MQEGVNMSKALIENYILDEVCRKHSVDQSLVRSIIAIEKNITVRNERDRLIRELVEKSAKDKELEAERSAGTGTGAGQGAAGPTG